MEQHRNDKTTDAMIDESLERAKLLEGEPRIVEAAYHPGPGLDFLRLHLSNGRRLLVPREELPELKSATDAQAKDLFITKLGVSVWWPQLDDGLYLPDFLEHRWGKVSGARDERPSVAA